MRDAVKFFTGVLWSTLFGLAIWFSVAYFYSRW